MEYGGNDGAPPPSLLCTPPVSVAGFLHQPIYVRPAHSCASPGSPTSSTDSTSRKASAPDVPRRATPTARWRTSGRDVRRVIVPCCGGCKFTLAEASAVVAAEMGCVGLSLCGGGRGADGRRRTWWRLSGGGCADPLVARTWRKPFWGSWTYICASLYSGVRRRLTGASCAATTAADAAWGPPTRRFPVRHRLARNRSV